MTKTNNATIVAIGTAFADLSELIGKLATEGIEVVPASVKETGKKSSKAVEVQEVDENEEAGELTADDLAEMSLAELKEVAKENEIEFTKSVKKPALLKLILASLEEEDEEEAEEEAEEEETEEEEEEVSTVVQTEDGNVDLSEMTLTKLKKFAKEYEIELSAKTKDGVIEEILEAINGDEDEEAEEEGEEIEDEEELDLDEMSLEELKEFAEENEIDLPNKKKVQKAPAYLQIVKDTIAEALADAEGEEDEEEEEEEEDIATALGLNEMELSELAELLADHELSTKGKKQALIARIVKAVEDGTIEVDEEEGE